MKKQEEYKKDNKKINKIIRLVIKIKKNMNRQKIYSTD